MLVLDNSVVMRWALPTQDENETKRAVLLYDRIDNDRVDIVVPQLFWLEVSNVAARAMKKGAIDKETIVRFFTDINSLSITTDSETHSKAFNEIFSLAEQYGITVYDATYLELALRRNAQLATLDKELEKAAKQAGAKLFFA